ncbi:MAG TPA: HAD family hydrolase [Candidatus Portnoybacteria bacterium]|nr:HAD family hydrolase [Candidatus Portnoybacteria bacterium]
MEKNIWHSFSIERTLTELKTKKSGLTEEEAKKRLQRFGFNKLPEEKRFSRLVIFLDQLKSPLIYILIVAGIITVLLKEYVDTIVIFGAVALNAVVGFIQENKVSRALSKLKEVIKPKTFVLREGNPKEIETGFLVPGDIILLKTGDKIPADSRLIEAKDLKVNEASLTGEWLPIKKDIQVLSRDVILAERGNMVHQGTVVERGKGIAVVTETGLKTQLGRIASLVKETKEEKTPLQKKLARFGKIVGAIISLVCLIIFFEGILTGNSFLEMFTTAVAIAVAAIPEGLPVAMTVILTLGMQRILKKKGLVKKLLAAETLGSTSVICTDKTGTLTEGKMKVAQILAESGQAGESLPLKIVTLCNEAIVENPEERVDKWIVRGRSTDKALLIAALSAGFNKKELEKKMPKIDELPFDSERKYMATLHQLSQTEEILYLSGSPEAILSISSFFHQAGQPKKITKAKQKELISKLENLTGQGLRVVAVAYRKIRKKGPGRLKIEEEDLKKVVFTGLIALKDPLRKEVKESIKLCRQAGLRPIIVTGDHRLTAKTIAVELGLPARAENILEGKELDKISDKELRNRVKKIGIYARATPKHKLRIIDAWQSQGEVVAMTGDGVNDAPALKKADIGVALGSGTAVAKEASDLILLTDNFSIIVAAVEGGRVIIDNIRKVITYLLSDSFTEMILIGLSLLLGWPLPILAGQILWVNLIEDGLPGIALAFEPKEKDIMQRKPEGHEMPLFTREMKVLVFIIGLITDLFLFGLLFWLLKYSGYEISHIRSVIFAGLAIDSIFYVFSCKSLRRNLWHINPFSNKFLTFSWMFGLMMLIVALYVPFFQTLLKTVPLNLFDWTLILGLGILNLILIELTKYYFIVKKKTG